MINSFRIPVYLDLISAYINPDQFIPSASESKLRLVKKENRINALTTITMRSLKISS